MPHRSATIVDSLEKDILEGRLRAGARLPSEEKLCAEYQASRSVVREAIQQLRGRGLIRTLKGSGSYIADSSLQTLGHAIATYSVLTGPNAYLELMDFRILIETECARLAARHAGERALEEMHAAQDQMRQCIGEREQFGSADIAFHLAIAKGSKNNLYATVLTGLEKRAIEYATTNRGDQDWYHRVLATHHDILAAITASSPDQAAEAMKNHLVLSKRHYVDLEE